MDNFKYRKLRQEKKQDLNLIVFGEADNTNTDDLPVFVVQERRDDLLLVLIFDEAFTV